MIQWLVHRLPLRIRLTVWVAGMATIIQLAVGLVFYLYQRQAVQSFFDEHLKLRSDGMIVELAPMMPGVTPADLARIAEAQRRYSSFAGFAIAVFDASGKVIATTYERVDHSTQAAEIAAVARSGQISYRVGPAVEAKRFDPDATRARAVQRSFLGKDGKRYVLLVGASDTHAKQMLGLVSNALSIAIPTGMLLAALSGWFIGGLAVRPLEVVRQSAARLTVERIDERIRVRDAASSGSASPEQIRLEEALEGARIRLAAAFASQERFMSNVSHELKTPIAVLLTEAQTLDLRNAPRDVEAYVRTAMDELRRLGSLVDSFLLLTRVREGRSLTQDKPYPLNELVMDSVSHCLPMANQYQVKLSPRLSGDDLRARVRGDPTLLRTMLDNLIRNAIRFSPQGAPIEVEASEEEDRLLIRVRDVGAGIPPQLLGTIFDRFVQGDGEHRRGRGHGLGLEIAQGIAELHSGRIEVRNRTEGENGTVTGCEFTVRLPSADAPVPTPAV